MKHKKNGQSSMSSTMQIIIALTVLALIVIIYLITSGKASEFMNQFT